ncbi:IS21 family transposase [Globicatella sanguinis]|uniref:IS21 family transposase n=1 Tax=Globicatella sanguinis TaxID=13076 RepID=UPI0008270E06|nr:IS21 family transposase [Globicatella sanguinis]
MKEKQTIIKLYLDGLSKRKIALLTKKSRNTVDKYIKEYERSKYEDVRDLPIAEDIVKPPTYKKRVGRRRVLSESIEVMLRDFIKENEWKKDHGMAKQQMKIVDMHEKLLDRGYSISYTTVRNFINEEVTKTKEVFIRRHAEPGYEVEFDWGEIKLFIDDKLKTFSLAVFTLAHSNYRFARIYQSESQICVLDVHTKFISHIGFIPSVFTYDNMRTVVKSFIGTEKTITDSMIHLSNYYQFKIRLCEPRKGNEKGHVERSVEFIRRKAFASTYRFSNLEEAQTHLNNELEKLNQRLHHEHKVSHLKLMQTEKERIGPTIIAPFDVSEILECRVDKYSTVVIKQNHYSVPEGHIGKYIIAKLSADQVKLFIEGEIIATHKRNWGVHQWEMNLYHYLETFKRKKGALAQSECLRQAPQQIKNLYHHHYIGKEKEFIILLHYMKDNNNFERVMAAVEELNGIRWGYVSTERILFLCEQSEPTEVSLARDETTHQSESNLKAYANLFHQADKEVIHYG